MGPNQTYKFCTEKETINKMKRQPTDWEKTFTNDVTNKGLISKIQTTHAPCLFNLCAEYIMRQEGLDEAQAGIKTAGRNTNNLRYAGDTTLTTESKKELKSLLKVKEESEKAGLKLNKKNEDHGI